MGRGIRTRSGAGVDHELRIGSLAHYEDPSYYAHNYRDRTEDVAYYVARAKEAKGPILEYGCGEGRIAIPIARHGIAVVGVDHSKPMLDALAAKLDKDLKKRIKTRRGDMRTLKLRRKFDTVLCTFNTFLHLYSRQDVESFLARVREHLTPRGRFIFDVSMPVPADLARDPARACVLPKVRMPDGRRYAYKERFDYEPIRQVLFVAMEFESADARGEQFVTPLAHRQFFPAELEALLHYNGLAVEKLEGGFRGEPADRHTDSLVYTCTRRRT